MRGAVYTVCRDTMAVTLLRESIKMISYDGLLSLLHIDNTHVSAVLVVSLASLLKFWVWQGCPRVAFYKSDMQRCGWILVVQSESEVASVPACSAPTLGENRASWSDKLDDALWAFHTAYKTPIGCTPYKLVYGKACHLPIELEHKAYSALKHANFDLDTVGDHRKVQLNELNELRDHAYENSLIYKEKTKRIHDSKIKNRIFNVGDQVLLFNSRLKMFSGKLKSCWSGPFTITQVFPYGTIELSQNTGPNFKKTEGFVFVGEASSKQSWPGERSELPLYPTKDLVLDVVVVFKPQ
ncbi:reverse transcriptase domain-containing protein [Tanacetum coccineum]